MFETRSTYSSASGSSVKFKVLKCLFSTLHWCLTSLIYLLLQLIPTGSPAEGFLDRNFDYWFPSRTDCRKEHHGRDGSRNVPRRGSGRGAQGGRHSDERRSKAEINRRVDRRDELSEAEKLRVQRFGAGKTL